MTPATSRKLRILDGGMSRELVRLGAELRQPEWSALALMETPAIVAQVHAEFIEAGADIITTNSYALVPFHIGEKRFRDEGLALAIRSGRLARQAADARRDRKVLVAGSLPPIFGSYEPQNFDPSRAQDYLSVLVKGLAPHVDVWLSETLSSTAEAEAALQATAGTRKPVWIAFALDDGDDAMAAAATRLRSGETVTEVAEWMAASKAEALFFNCSQAEAMAGAVRAAAAVFVRMGAKIDIGVYANAFEPRKAAPKANTIICGTRGDLTPDLYARFAAEWADAGATIIGGCCGIGVSHIHKLASAFGRHRTPRSALSE